MLVRAMVVVLASAVAGSSTVRPKNITVYRVTPHNITGDITNLNTGDAGGDGYFSTYEMIFPLYCDQQPTDGSCTARKSLNIPNNNVFEESIVEVDPRFGVYNGCIPNVTVKDASQCEPYADTSTCWWNITGPDDTGYANSFKGLCDPKVCVCDAVLNRSVGAYHNPMSQWPVHWHNQTAMWQQIELMSRIWDGYWYSTLKGGECAPDQAVGTGACFWKFHGVQRRVNATCVKKRIAAKIEARNAKCFAALPDPTNVSTVGWAECIMTGITGVAYNSVVPAAGAMSKAELVEPFVGAFKDVADGGCPV
jgi:hypothetical protein